MNISTCYKRLFLFLLSLMATGLLRAQKIEGIYVDLYTDSLKKGTYNYINIDGLLSNGKYTPLDSSHLILKASAGKFSGNNLWIDPDFSQEKITIRATLKKDPTMFKEFDVYIKKLPDPPLKKVEEIMRPPVKWKSKKGDQ
ncbi:MAG: hypothetical protein NTX08_07095 [Sphingobacteriales bacterium]|nr:hypothetical protein [Sphingobacteriales bacterium]